MTAAVKTQKASARAYSAGNYSIFPPPPTTNHQKHRSSNKRYRERRRRTYNNNVWTNNIILYICHNFCSSSYCFIPSTGYLYRVNFCRKNLEHI